MGRKKKAGFDGKASISFKYDDSDREMFDLVCAYDKRSRSDQLRYWIKQRFDEIIETVPEDEMKELLESISNGNIPNNESIAEELIAAIKENMDSFNKLDAREQTILKMRAGIDGTIYTYAEIAAEVKLSRQRVQKILEAALKKLKE